MDQILRLLEESKNTSIHMQVLFDVLMGLRRQEINAVKYSDMDYINRTLKVERQLGKKCERWRSRRNSIFYDDGYICCSNYIGKPRSKDSHWRHYKKLLKKAGLPDIRWHDLRITYCTLLLNKDFNPKAVSKLMGRAKELMSYMDVDEVMPKKANRDNKGANGQNDVSDTVIDLDGSLPDNLKG